MFQRSNSKIVSFALYNPQICMHQNLNLSTRNSTLSLALEFHHCALILVSIFWLLFDLIYYFTNIFYSSICRGFFVLQHRIDIFFFVFCFFFCSFCVLLFCFSKINAMDAGSLSSSNANHSRCPLQEQHLQKKHSRENVSVWL